MSYIKCGLKFKYAPVG